MLRGPAEIRRRDPLKHVASTLGNPYSLLKRNQELPKITRRSKKFSFFRAFSVKLCEDPLRPFAGTPSTQDQ